MEIRLRSPIDIWASDEEKGASDGVEAAADDRVIVMREMGY